jgi:hypothetical protein
VKEEWFRNGNCRNLKSDSLAYKEMKSAQKELNSLFALPIAHLRLLRFWGAW